MVVATKMEHQTNCSVEYGLKTPLKIGRKSDKYEIAVVKPRMHEGHHKRTEAVVGDVST